MFNATRIVWLAVFVCLFVNCLSTRAQSRVVCDSDITDADGYKIWQVKVDARYARISLPAKGTPFTRALESQLLNDVRDAFKRERNRENEIGATLFQLAGLAPTLFELNFLTTCVRRVEAATCREVVGQDKCVNVTVDAKSLRFSPDGLGENLLAALPRSAATTMLSEVPKPLLFLNPKFGLTADRMFGPAETVALSTNLLDLGKNIKGEPLAFSSQRLDLRAQGQKSLSQPYYDSAVSLAYTRKLPSNTVPVIGAEASFTAHHQPLGEGHYLRNALSLSGQASFKLPLPVIKQLDFSAGYRHASQRLFRATGKPELTDEQALQASALLNGSIKEDFWRAGVWYERGSPDVMIGQYQRVAGLMGYAKEFGRGNQTVGVEVLVGAGRAWGNLPRYAQFFGGNNGANFLYDATAMNALMSFPTGPVLRSFGRNQFSTRDDAAQQGASSYAHLNLSVALPIPAWSKPLIPDEELEIDDPVTGETKTRKLRQVIKNQARSGETILKKIYARQGIANADKQATKDFGAINSALNFIVDRANLFAVKPLFLFDAARVKRTGDLSTGTRLGFGAGVQFTVTIAKFEAGYIFAARRQPTDPRGNFMLRLYFQNLF